MDLALFARKYSLFQNKLQAEIERYSNEKSLNFLYSILIWSYFERCFVRYVINFRQCFNNVLMRNHLNF